MGDTVAKRTRGGQDSCGGRIRTFVSRSRAGRRCHWTTPQGNAIDWCSDRTNPIVEGKYRSGSTFDCRTPSGAFTNMCSYECTEAVNRCHASSRSGIGRRRILRRRDLAAARHFQADGVLSPPHARDSGVRRLRETLRLGCHPRLLRCRQLDDAVHAGVRVQPKRLVGCHPPRRDLATPTTRADRHRTQPRATPYPSPRQAQVAGRWPQAARCEECGLSEWRGKALSLELHHVNGDGLDNRLENLVLLCPNCHSQTDTWGGRNKGGRAAA